MIEGSKAKCFMRALTVTALMNFDAHPPFACTCNNYGYAQPWPPGYLFCDCLTLAPDRGITCKSPKRP